MNIGSYGGQADSSRQANPQQNQQSGDRDRSAAPGHPDTTMRTIADHSGRDPLAVLLDSLVASRPDGLEPGLVALDLAPGRSWLQPEASNAAVQTAPEPQRLGESPDRQDRSVVPRLIRQAPPPPATQGEATVPLEPAINRAALTAAPGSPWRVLEAVPGSSTTPLRRLWLYDPTGTGVNNTAALPALETVVVTHGWRGQGVGKAPDDPTGFGAAFTAMASAIAIPGKVQVLFQDWGVESIDPSPAGVAPYNAAGRVQAVATWASQQLQPLANSGKPLTLVGHSLGAYVCTQTAIALGSPANLRLVALDPAASGLNGAYDLNTTNSTTDQVPNLSKTVTAGASLAFVVAETNFSIGIAGDNAVAGTAANSFVVKGFASNTAAGDAHGAITTLYADLARYLAPNAATTKELLGSFQSNRFSDSGSTSGTRRHEGAVTVRSKSLGILASIDGFTTGGGAQKVSFVEAEIADPAGSSSSLDTIVALRDVSLGTGNSIEKIVLGGRANLTAKGNALAQTLNGNEGNNRLEGAGGIDSVTGGDGADTFAYSSLLDSLIGGTSKAPRFESITDFDLRYDQIDAPGNSARAVAMLGSVGAALTTSAITTLLNRSDFAASAAACFSFGNRTFLGVNDTVAGFSSAQDAVIEITGFQPQGLALSSLIIA